MDDYDDVTDVPVLPPRRYAKEPQKAVPFPTSLPPRALQHPSSPLRTTTQQPELSPPSQSSPLLLSAPPQPPLPTPAYRSTSGVNNQRHQLTRQGYEGFQIPHQEGGLKVGRQQEKSRRQDKEDVIIINVAGDLSPTVVQSPTFALPPHSVFTGHEDKLNNTLPSVHTNNVPCRCNRPTNTVSPAQMTNTLTFAGTNNVSSVRANTSLPLGSNTISPPLPAKIGSSSHKDKVPPIRIGHNENMKLTESGPAPVASAFETCRSPIGQSELSHLSPHSYAKFSTMSVESLQDALLKGGLCDKAAIFLQRVVDGEMFLAMSDEMLLNEPFSLTNFEMLQITRLRDQGRLPKHD